MTDQVPDTIFEFYTNFKTFRTKDKYTDLSIQCGGKHFKCHRLILASASPFFDAKFGTGIEFNGEDKEFCLPINEVHFSTLQNVLKFMYTGDVSLNSANICELYNASKIFRVCSLAGRCVEFIKTNKIAALATLNLFKIAIEEKNDLLVPILSKDIAAQMSIFSKTNIFLDITPYGFRCIAGWWKKSINDESNLCAAAQWAVNRPPKEHLDSLIEFETKIDRKEVSTEVLAYISKLMQNQANMKRTLGGGRKCSKNDPTMIPQTAVISSTLATKKLYLFIKYAEEESKAVQIFSIDENKTCESSGEVHLKDKSLWIQTAVVKDHLYSLEYIRRNFGEIHNQQSFYVYNSIEMHHQSLKLNTPPIVFGDVILCNERNNNIYAYNQTLRQPIVRTNSRCSGIFDDEEISRGLYLYNADLDVWLPVPAMKKRVEDACLTTYNDSLYLIGGTSDPLDSLAQSYDCREGKWGVLSQNSHNYHFGANCCEYNGKIYVCGGSHEPITGVERYDPSCGKWEVLQQKMAHKVEYHHLVSYHHKLWSLGSSIYQPLIQSYPHDYNIKIPSVAEPGEECDLIDIYEIYVEKNTWRKEVDLSNTLERPEGGSIIQGIIF